MPKKTGSRYTEEFKGEAVQLARSFPEKSIRQLAYELGIADQTLRNWIKQAEIDRREQEGLTTEERQELRRLRRENRILREERKILKKGGGGFNRSVQHGRFWVLSGPEVHEWRDWVVLEGCRRRARRTCGSGGGPGSPSAT